MYVPAAGLAAALTRSPLASTEAEVAASVADVTAAVRGYDPATELVVVLEHDGLAGVEVLRPEVPPPVWRRRLAAEAAADAGGVEEGGRGREPQAAEEDLYLRP